ncbi:MAG: hypothetical protein KDC43_14010, partial [Saprospiraceae bacterium]|nr:hypothetical protein [Saprospiraceae bacterium]MCB0624988.1 hypothetical protein [Saprospiraceae bacterium]
FGLLATTFIILILLPVLLIVMNRFKVYAAQLWNGVKPSYEAVETATPGDGGYEYLWYVLIGFGIVAAGLSFFA